MRCFVEKMVPPEVHGCTARRAMTRFWPKWHAQASLQHHLVEVAVHSLAQILDGGAWKAIPAPSTETSCRWALTCWGVAMLRPTLLAPVCVIPPAVRRRIRHLAGRAQAEATWRSMRAWLVTRLPNLWTNGWATRVKLSATFLHHGSLGVAASAKHQPAVF